MGELIFILLAVIIICSAAWVVISPNLIHSAVSLLFTLFGVAGLYVFLYADFIAATQVVIYVGGILVLIIFGVMLTNKIENVAIPSKSYNQIIGLFVTSFVMLIQILIILQTDWFQITGVQEGPSTVKIIGTMILTDYLLPFELVSVVLLGALVGAAMLSRKKTS